MDIHTKTRHIFPCALHPDAFSLVTASLFTRRWLYLRVFRNTYSIQGPQLMDFPFFKKKLFGAMLDHYCMQAFSSCSEQGLLFFAVCGLLIAVASPIMEHRL